MEGEKAGEPERTASVWREGGMHCLNSTGGGGQMRREGPPLDGAAWTSLVAVRRVASAMWQGPQLPQTGWKKSEK